MGRPKIFYGPLTVERVRASLDYNPETGVFTWKVRKRAFAGNYVEIGQRAGSINDQGYWMICIDRKRVGAHRLAWFLMTGAWPAHEIDHINLKRDDNRWCNLRQATDKENCANRPVRNDNLLGIKGVSVRIKKNMVRYRVRVHKKDGKRHHVGYFGTPEEAHAAYTKAIIEEYGEFARAA